MKKNTSFNTIFFIFYGVVINVDEKSGLYVWVPHMKTGRMFFLARVNLISHEVNHFLFFLINFFFAMLPNCIN